MHGVGISSRVDGNGSDAKLLTCPLDAERNLTPVGNQDLVEHWGSCAPAGFDRVALAGTPLVDDDERLPKLYWLTILDENMGHGASLRRGNVIHRLHGFNDHQGLALGHACANLDKR